MASEDTYPAASGLRPKSAAQPPHGLRRCQEGAADDYFQFLAEHWWDSETGYVEFHPASPTGPTAVFIPVAYYVDYEEVLRIRHTFRVSGTMETPTSKYDDSYPLQSSD